MTTLAVVSIIVSSVGYLVGIGATFQLAAALKGQDVYGRPRNELRWRASCVWPITALIAAGLIGARWFQRRQARPPRATARDRAYRNRNETTTPSIKDLS